MRTRLEVEDGMSNVVICEGSFSSQTAGSRFRKHQSSDDVRIYM